MSHLLPWLTENVRSAVEKCGALGASVYVPTPWNEAAPGILVQVGQAAPLPEMATMDEAFAFAQRAANRLAARAGKSAIGAVVPSAAPEGCFIPIPLLAALWHRSSADQAFGAEAAERSRRLSDHREAPPIVGWLGLRFAEPSDRAQLRGGWQSVLELASVLASTYVCFYGILTDPVTGLPGRAELNGTLRAELDRAQTLGLPFSLLFVKIEGLDGVNERFGRRAGDTVLRQFLETLHATIRGSDTVMRYGATIFALPLRDVTASGALVVGEKIRRRISEHRFFDGSLRLPCAVGVASCDGHDSASLEPLDLLRRADQALFVSRRDGCRKTALWRADGDVASAEHLDPLLGVFTGQAEKDYRNMRLLWDVLQSLSGAAGAELAPAVVAQMFSLFAATRAALFQTSDHGLQLTTGQRRQLESGGSEPLSPEDIRPEEWRLNQDAWATLEPRHASFDGESFGHHHVPLTGFAVPLVIHGRALGTLYLLSESNATKIDQTDFPVLSGVATQLALALDREQLAVRQRQREQHEQRLLKTEVDQLRTVLKQARFVFRSKPMADLLNTARRVASTDATVLITGESGTGKEMLAHTLHELSGRRHKPLVIVDCGTIPASLIDSELFGRERGAYTGAERRAVGRLAQADGGTVFLDEIGELPLDVQAKLLRFVQEKTITMVGDTRAQKVNVRIIAATNRSLEDEVRDGRFREDLFHRLNVVRLRIPPLRERPDDVLFLARHFLETFATQYAKDVRGLTPDAEQALATYEWPGNVRELQNTILQAVVLAEGELLTAHGLQLQDASRARIEVSPESRATLADDQAAADGFERTASPATTDAAPRFESAWRTLGERLTAELSATMASGAHLGFPLGKWLNRDLVLEAYERSNHIVARAAILVGLPETTFARRLRQAEAHAASTRQPESWSMVRAGVSDVLRAPDRPSRNLADRVDQLLFDLVVASVPDRIAQAAALMGISVPTMKRRMAQGQPTDHNLNVYA